MATAAILKITNIAISPQQFELSLRNLARLCKMGLLTVLAVKNWIFKIEDGGRPPFWKPLNCHISATVWPIRVISIYLSITRMRRSAYAFLHPTPPKPLNKITNFDVMSNILLRLPRELMCKIWLVSIWPLRICACVKKHGLCGFFY